MLYRLKNISTEMFAFEGVTLAPGTESHDLEPEVYQRLLAIYYPTILVPVEDASFQSPDENTGTPTPTAEPAASEDSTAGASNSDISSTTATPVVEPAVSVVDKKADKKSKKQSNA